jgi:uncharacterized protein
MNEQMNDQPITDEDLDFIDSIFEKYATDNSIVSVSELDGFLTAIVSGPDMIMPSEWLPEIWGGAEHMPNWESEDEVTRFIQIVMGIMNDNAEVLAEQPEDFQALVLVDMQQDKPVDVVSLWCCGYVRGVSMCGQTWTSLPEDLQAQLSCIALFGSEEGEEIIGDFADQEVEALKQEIEPAARALHAYWLAKRAHLAPGQQHPGPKAQVLPFVRPQPEIGPNEPCPCGSGEKYKKCCGAG